MDCVIMKKLFCAPSDKRDIKNEKENQNIYMLRGINREQGCPVVVRPDQYIANVLPLKDTVALAAFFKSFILDERSKHPLTKTGQCSVNCKMRPTPRLVEY